MSPGRTALACALAWLVPGAGHLYLRRPLKATLFFCLVLVMFFLGVSLHGRAHLMGEEQPLLSTLAAFANIATGPLDLLARTGTYHKIIYRLPPKEHPDHDELVERIRARVLEPTYEYGTIFILTAGLMNILLILDAFDIAIGRKA
ncbi:MAG: DUF6677 family protein [Acidobacteriota bacterium]